MKALGTVAASAGAFAVVLAMATGSASALSTKECSTKYQAAKDAGKLAGKTWNQFRKEECAAGDAPAAAAPAPAVEEKKTAAKAPAPAAKPAAPKVASTGGVAFPSALSAKFASETPAKQRFHTCLEQYNANKASGGNGDLKWIQKGGGYYSQCNARLKQ